MKRLLAALALWAGAAAACSIPTDVDMTDTSGAELRSPSDPRSAASTLLATPLSFADLAGWAADDHSAAFATFFSSCRAILDAAPALRPGRAPSDGLVAACRAALAQPAPEPRGFFERWFAPWRIRAPDGSEGFFTGYYEPEVAASPTEQPGFAAPLRARPRDLVSFDPEAPPPGAPEGYAAALRAADGALRPTPSRGEIEAGAFGEDARPIAYVADPIEAFMIQVQGSARLRMPDGRTTRAVYDGRNGHPYTSIGRLLVTEHGLKPEAVTLDALKAWVRAAGQRPGEAGLALLHRNASFVFFRLDDSAPEQAGPIGAQGLRLTRLRSIAVDRTIWPYGTPVWIDAQTPWESEAASRLARLTIAQDTGSAILGPARADIFHGSGEEAGRIAGATRHRGAFVALLPRGESAPGAAP